MAFQIIVPILILFLIVVVLYLTFTYTMKPPELRIETQDELVNSKKTKNKEKKVKKKNTKATGPVLLEEVPTKNQKKLRKRKNKKIDYDSDIPASIDLDSLEQIVVDAKGQVTKQIGNIDKKKNKKKQQQQQPRKESNVSIQKEEIPKKKEVEEKKIEKVEVSKKVEVPIKQEAIPVKDKVEVVKEKPKVVEPKKLPVVSNQIDVYKLLLAEVEKKNEDLLENEKNMKSTITELEKKIESLKLEQNELKENLIPKIVEVPKPVTTPSVPPQSEGGEVEKLRKQLEVANQEINSLKESTQLFIERIRQTTSEQSKNNKNKELLEEQLRKLSNDKELIFTEKNKSDMELALYKKKMLELESENRSMKNMMDQQQTQVGNAKKSQDEIVAKLQRLHESKICQLTSDKERSEQKFELATNDLRLAQKNCEQIKQMHDANISNMKSQLEQMGTTFDELQQEKYNTEVKMGELEKEKQKLSEELEDLKEKVPKSDKLEELKKINAVMEEEAIFTNTKFNEEIKELNQLLVISKENLTKLDDKNKELRDRSYQTTDALKKEEKNVADKQKIIDDLQEVLRDLNENNTNLSGDRSQLEKMKESLELENAELQHRCEKLTEKNALIAQELPKLDNSVTIEMVKLRARLDEAIKDNKQLQDIVEKSGYNNNTNSNENGNMNHLNDEDTNDNIVLLTGRVLPAT
ncbi:hypothetical protein SNEBB_004743 [Seison nebaliae]|nr:hypothetical protein SNEBB_004743 [Seison nebaliae]